MHLFKWTVILAVFWLLLSGFIQPLLLSFGAVSIALCLIIIHRMQAVDNRPQMLRLSPRSLLYYVWLLGQIVLSGLAVAKLVWTSPKKLKPSLAQLPLDDIPKDARVLYANSITLTPGTLSVDLDHDTVTVHALEAQSIEDLKAGDMARKVSSATGGSEQ